MRAVVFTQTGGPEVLQVMDGDALQPKSLRWARFGVFNAWQQLDVWDRGVANLVP